MSKLEQINAFIAVVEENGFVSAAKKLGTSTASISRQVAQLESILGVALLHRTTRIVTLTEIGADYYQHAKTALLELDNAEAEIINSHDAATGVLTVMSSRYFAMKHLIPRLPAFMDENPKLRVNMELAERFPDLIKENIDLIFGVSLEGPAELVRRQVGTTRYVLCASPAYLKTHGTPQVPADLNQHLYITHMMRQPDNVVAFKDGKQIYVKPVLGLTDSRAMCDCAIQNMGIIKVHDYMVADALLNGILIEVLKEFQEKEKPVYLYYRQSKYLHPKIRRFIDFYCPS